jgi:hypothetical protein
VYNVCTISQRHCDEVWSVHTYSEPETLHKTGVTSLSWELGALYKVGLINYTLHKVGLIARAGDTAQGVFI